MKKLNKTKKLILSAFAFIIGLSAAIGLPLRVISTCADETPVSVEESVENVEILDESATDDQVVDGNEMDENDSVLDEETADNSAILDEIKNYLDSRKDESGKVSLKAVLADAKTWIVTALSFIGSTGIGAILVSVINRINKRKEILTDAQVEKIATAAASKAVEKVVGKSIDVDISAEVSKAVKKELYNISAAMESVVDGVKNTEMLVASEAVALSHSRIISVDEKQALLDYAKRAKAHAGKVVSAAKIEIEATEPTTKSSTEKTESVEEKNMQYFNFDGVEKK